MLLLNLCGNPNISEFLGMSILIGIPLFFLFKKKILNFKSDFHKTLFTEGQRRTLIVVSILIPIAIGLLNTGMFIITVIISYLIFHLGIYLYKWIKEGYDEVNY